MTKRQAFRLIKSELAVKLNVDIVDNNFFMAAGTPGGLLET